jgi:hypothetical protein
MESEEFLEILDYLPIYFLTEENREFIEYLKNIFRENWKEIKDKNGNKICELNQISFKAYYDLYIIFIFIKIWQIRKFDQESFEKYFNSLSKEVKNKTGGYSTPFHISVANEKDIFNFIRSLGFNGNAIDKFSSVVKVRDHCSHPCGVIEYSKEDLEKEMEKIIKYCEEILDKSKKMIGSFLNKFLLGFDFDLLREYLELDKEDKKQVEEYKKLLKEYFEEELIRKNYLSHKDLKSLRSFEIKNLFSEANYDEIKIVFDLFMEFYNLD